MADNQNNAQNNKAPREPKRASKKKNSTSVKLPNARKSIKRQRHMAQGRAEWNSIWELVGGIAVVLLVIFILLGGINQKAFIETASEWAQTIGQKFQEVIHPDQVLVEDDGVYYDLDGDGNRG